MIELPPTYFLLYLRVIFCFLPDDDGIDVLTMMKIEYKYYSVSIFTKELIMMMFGVDIMKIINLKSFIKMVPTLDHLSSMMFN